MEATFFPNLMAFLWIGIMLMLGVFLRAKVRFFQRILFPASIIGGLIGFVLVNAGWLGAPSTQGWKVLDHTPFGVLTFHLFAFSFVGIGFLETARASDSSKVVLRGALWIALLFTMMFCLQALLGKGIFSGWVALFGGSFETVNGYLLGAGFTQGPGQTLAYASIWEKTYHVASAINTGLAFAAVGFLVAGLVGGAAGPLRHQARLGELQGGERPFQGAPARPARPLGQACLCVQHHPSGQYRLLRLSPGAHGRDVCPGLSGGRGLDALHA